MVEYTIKFLSHALSEVKTSTLSGIMAPFFSPIIYSQKLLLHHRSEIPLLAFSKLLGYPVAKQKVLVLAHLNAVK